ncbi:MAG: DUF1772 domain-containing protein [Pseudonocardia sp.]|nr:DUF1772 domain-containing protein [Pseudonocardia sp.]
MDHHRRRRSRIVSHFGRGGAALAWTIAGFGGALVTFVVTAALNVPLNDALAAAGDPDRIVDLAGVRERFEPSWTGWNTVRALASTVALGCLTWALALFSRSR